MVQVIRQIRWEARSEEGPERHSYTILVVNTKTEIARIRQRMIEAMQPIEDFEVVCSGSVSGGVGYQLHKFVSYGAKPGAVNWNEIYGGAVKRDRDLYDRENVDGLADFVERRVRDWVLS